VLVAATDWACTGGAANPGYVGTTATPAITQPAATMTRIRFTASLSVT